MANAMTSTVISNVQFTKPAPVNDSGSTNLGKYTFCTRLALSTIDRTPWVTVDWKNSHGSRPHTSQRA